MEEAEKSEVTWYAPVSWVWFSRVYWTEISLCSDGQIWKGSVVHFSSEQTSVSITNSSESGSASSEYNINILCLKYNSLFLHTQNFDSSKW